MPRTLIRVDGSVAAQVEEALADRFAHLAVRTDAPTTVLTGRVEDPEELGDTLGRLTALGVGVLEVVWVPA
ncbi:hypothetical protein [Nocardioides sp.]|uniref:hypothetical protein n=1 Tax=Nocardioides sp. TaxID=35761 RepID=UPI003784DBB2